MLLTQQAGPTRSDHCDNTTPEYMDDLSSIIFSVVGALFILIALPVGLGVAMHMHTRFPRVALPALAAALALVPPLGLLLAGRNLSVRNLNFDTQLDAGGLSAWLFRLTSASVILIAVTAALVYLMRRTKENPAGRIVLVGFITYFVSNIILNGLFGTVPSLVTAHLYALLVLGALYVNRTTGLADVLAAIRWGLFLMLSASVLWMVVGPQVVMQTNTPEVRLPFVNFRFWGLGDGPNSIAPMALMSFLITIYQPFRFRILSLASIAAALTVLVLAQSMTTWIAAVVVIPPYFLIRFLTHPTKGEARKISGFGAIAMITLAGALMVGAAALLLDLNELQRGISEFVGLARGQEGAALSGRAGIWAVAVRVFLENPLFGYGPTAWDLAFRSKINMMFAFHAHNLFFQAISVAGLVGLAGTIFYVAVMGWQALKLTWYTRGLAPALFMMFMFRSVSEVPLELSSILTGSFLMLFTLFHVLCAGAWEMAQPQTKPAESPAPEPVRAKPHIPDPVRPTLPAGMKPVALPRTLAEAPARKPQPALQALVQNATRHAPEKARGGPAPTSPASTSSSPPRRQQPTPTSPTHAEPRPRPERNKNEPDQLGRVEPRLDL